MAERNIVIEHGKHIPPSSRETEIVERKGLGHPDTLIDGAVEAASRELCKEYISRFGRILHHNLDKGQICAGGSNPEFGGGKITKPIHALLSGRATFEAEGKKIPASDIAIDAAKRYLERTIRNIDIEHGAEFESRIAPGSKDLVELFLRGPKIPFANDTSIGVGFAPFSSLERLVLATEEYLNSPSYKRKHPECGEDIKVMGMRQGGRIRLSVAVAFVSRHVSSLKDYRQKKSDMRSDLMGFAAKTTGSPVEVLLNTADDEKSGSVYLTVTGTSAEAGDDGQVGRGNRVNGLITPMRQMTLEAAAGKNPVSHVGKIYSVLADELAMAIVEDEPEIEDVSISLLSQIGKPIDRPELVSVSLVCAPDAYARASRNAQAIVDEGLADITELTDRIVSGKRRVF